MAVIRVNKTADYTVLSNYHFKEKEMSLKAKGLLSLMLSLPDDWDYSIAGLVTLSKDGKDSVMNALTELETFGYLKRTRLFDKQGRFAGFDYDIFEKPQTEIPYSEKPNTEKPQQLNNKKMIDRLINNNLLDAIKKQIEYDVLSTRGYWKEDLPIIVDAIATLKTTTEPQKFGENIYDPEYIRARADEVNMYHIECVLECFYEKREKIRNIKSYLKAAVFNATITLGAFYTNAVRADGFID